MVQITIQDNMGVTKEVLDAEDGTNLMRFFVENGVDGIDGDCSGCMSCATCLVLVAEEHRDLLPPASEEEAATIAALTEHTVAEGYRLSCQIDAPKGLASLTLTVTEDEDVF
ncbi:2Fe-2S iron-sulfur cluster-binding protein [Celeribacter persicus]|uniref:2Fe-2S ferredoxin n=1 Tax=Celeribacter persicus TaxID=1651082 RepID=A0A2T5HUP8_9RHOB|nr:2Fe-2S iron-sulfur cluster-binding protein [Celeribacter persicus]PTQ75294.1 2Fe-2S ferredoxin [Celeribacter persicus]